MAAQNGDMQGVMMQLNLALNALEAKLTTTAEVANNATNAAGSEFNEEEGGRAEEGTATRRRRRSESRTKHDTRRTIA